MNIVESFQNGPKEKGAFLSRVFGIFNEEIIRIWARDPQSPYSISDRRPTLYDESGRYTLDFLFIRDGHSYVSEMKCEIQYQNYKYWMLEDASQLEHHRGRRAFDLFLEVARDPVSINVRAGSEIKPSGAILVWGAVSPNGAQSVQDRFGICDVISMEDCVRDLVKWGSSDYRELIAEKRDWCNDLCRTLLGSDGENKKSR